MIRKERRTPKLVSLKPTEEMKPQEAEADQHMKYISLVLLVFFTSAQVLCMRYARTTNGASYDTSTAVILGEIMKLIMSFLLLCKEKGSLKQGLNELRTEVAIHTKDVLKQAIPAVLYTIQNNFLYLAISNLEAAVFQICSQLKLLTAAVFSVVFLRKHVSPLQWMSLIVLGSGVVLVQYNANAAGPKENTNLVLGMLSVVISCTTSGFAGVYMEKMFKDSKFSLWSRNVWLAIFSILVGTISILLSKPSLLLPLHFFNGYTLWAWLAISLLAIGGLIIAMVLKYADNILKAFGNSASILVSSVLSVFLFDFKISTHFAIGCSLVMIAIVLYSIGAKGVQKLFLPSGDIAVIFERSSALYLMNMDMGDLARVVIPVGGASNESKIGEEKDNARVEKTIIDSFFTQKMKELEKNEKGKKNIIKRKGKKKNGREARCTDETNGISREITPFSMCKPKTQKREKMEEEFPEKNIVKKVDITRTYDLFLTKEQREEKKRINDEKKTSIQVNPEKKASLVPFMFLKPSKRKEVLREESTTSFKQRIQWKLLPDVSYPSTHSLRMPSTFIHDGFLPSATPSMVPAISLSMESYFVEKTREKEDIPIDKCSCIPLTTHEGIEEEMSYYFDEKDRSKYLKYLKYLKSLCHKPVNRYGLWSIWSSEYDLSCYWQDTNNELIDDIKDWLKQWQTIDLDADDLDCIEGERPPINAYLISGYEGKTSLVYALSAFFHYKIIEVNNSDKSCTNLINEIQEATQSRVFRSQNKGKPKKPLSFTQCPLILLDDIDINQSNDLHAANENKDLHIQDYTDGDIYSAKMEKNSLKGTSFIRGVKQLCCNSKCPIICTCTSYTEEMTHCVERVLTMKKRSNQSVYSQLKREEVYSLIMESEYDYRRSMNCLQFYCSSSSPLGESHYLSLLQWPYRRDSGISSYPFDLEGDSTTSYFLYSNLLRFCCNSYSVSVSTYHPCNPSVFYLSPSLLNNKGDVTVIHGEHLNLIATILIEGDSVTILERSDDEMKIELGERAVGMYFLSFILQDGSCLCDYESNNCLLLCDNVMNEKSCSDDDFDVTPTTRRKWMHPVSPTGVANVLFRDEKREVTGKDMRLANEEEEEIMEMNNIAAMCDSICDIELLRDKRINNKRLRDDTMILNNHYVDHYSTLTKQYSVALYYQLYHIYAPSTLPVTYSCELLSIESQIMMERQKQEMRESLYPAIYSFEGFDMISYAACESSHLSYVAELQRLAYLDYSCGEETRRGKKYPIFQKLSGLHNSDRILPLIEILMMSANYNSLCSEEDRRRWWPELTKSFHVC